MADPERMTDSREPFEEILDRYGRLLRATIVRLCPRQLGLQFDDIEQEARLRLWKALQGETRIGNAASYLSRIAITATIDAIRRVVARREEQLRLIDEVSEEEHEERPGVVLAVPAENSPEALAQRRLLLRKVERALARLEPEHRRAVGLHLRGFRPAEIGRLLEWSEPKARSLVYRGLAQLRERLAAEGIEYEAG
jgi:RNA polymerase sigma-70 factor (ECF subfamily)